MPRSVKPTALPGAVRGESLGAADRRFAATPSTASYAGAVMELIPRAATDRRRGGRRAGLITDGPFAETREQFG